ncbi:MAG: STAS domain-containing protein [Thermodesulfovibrionales bacterium]|nr:STAS domain-containing protein [Thermodesulfovibrionales bacterium]
MKITTEDIPKGKLIMISGEIDMHTSPALRDVLMKLTKKKVTPIIVDLLEVSYMDSSAIATFVEALKNMMSYKGSLRLCNLSQRVSEIFTFAKLNKIFEIYKTREDALKNC